MSPHIDTNSYRHTTQLPVLYTEVMSCLSSVFFQWGLKNTFTPCWKIEQPDIFLFTHSPFAFIFYVLLMCVCSTAPPQPTGQYNMVGTPAMAGTGSVLMIYGLAQGKFNCDHIFNLLCSYGNVLKVCMRVCVRVRVCVYGDVSAEQSVAGVVP